MKKNEYNRSSTIEDLPLLSPTHQPMRGPWWGEGRNLTVLPLSPRWSHPIEGIMRGRGRFWLASCHRRWDIRPSSRKDSSELEKDSSKLGKDSSELVSEDALFKKEKESARRTARCHVSLEKSSKNYIRCESEPSQAAIPSVPPPPTSRPKGKLRGRIFHVVRENVRVGGVVATRHGDSPLGGGRAGWSADWYHSTTDHQFCAQFNMKVDNDVLLLSYFNKICLTLTGNLWGALASLYSEARLYKGPRTATRPQSTTLHSTGNISVWTKEVSHSNTRGRVRLCSFPLKFTAAQ